MERILHRDCCFSPEIFEQEREQFTRAGLALHPVRVESWGGFVFLDLTPADPTGR
jgi:hypothetical protein